MNEVYAFLVATFLSLYGSLMAGLVNVNVVYCALHQSTKQAKWMALGGVLPELLYSAIAVFGVELVKSNEHLFEILKYAVAPILIIMGVVFIFQKQKPNELKKDTSNGSSFWKGLLLAMLNPQLITFWFGWLLICHSFIDFEHYHLISPKITFVLGTAVGAYLMLRIFILITVLNRERILGWMKININVLMGSILIALGLIQLAAVLWL